MATKIHISKTGSIVDSNGNEYIEFAETASATNHLKITNKANGSAPLLSTVGSSDSNVNLRFHTQGTGVFQFSATDANTAGTLRLMEPDGSEYVQITATDIGTSYTLTLPNAVGGADQVLKTDASGNLSWTDQSGGSPSGVQTGITGITNASFTTIGKGIGGSGTDDFIDFSTSDQIITKVNNTDRFNVGNAGVTVTGTASVSGATTMSGALTLSSSGATTTIKNTASSATTSGGKLVLACDDNAAIAATHRLGVLEFQGSESTSDTLITGARIEAVAGATWNNTYNLTNLDMYSTVGDNKEAKVLTLTGAGTLATSNYLKISSSSESDSTYPTIQSMGHANAGMAFQTSGTGVFQFSGGGTTTPGTLRLMEPSACGTNYIDIKPPAINNNYTLTLPNAVGSANQVLTTDAGGNLSWTTTGDITSVGAGTNLTGGGSCGGVTLNLNSALTNITSISKDGNTGIFIANTSIYNSTGNTIVINGNTSITNGISNGSAIQSIFIGNNTAQSVTTGDYNTVCGYKGGLSLTTGSGNTLLGFEATTVISMANGNTHATNSTNTTVVLADGGLSLANDFYNGNTITVTNGAASNSADMIARITDYVGSSKTATISVISGAPSANGSSLDNKAYTITSGEGVGLTTGANNTCLGYRTGVSVASGTNQTSVGYQALCTADNQVSLGDANVTTLRCATSTIATVSDQRDKTNIVDSTYGLDFINTISPRQYTWNTRNGSVRDGKTNIGFIAQELQSAMGEGENDILDLVLDVNSEKLEIKPGNFIPILVKAVKDLSAANIALEARVAALENA